MPIDKTPAFCAAGSRISFQYLNLAIILSDLHWRMNVAQFTALELVAKGFTITNVVEAEIPQELLPKVPQSHTLMGLPIVLDKDMNNHWIELRRGAEVLYRIDALAVPVGFD